RKILAFHYQTQLAAHNFDPSNFLGLAEVHLQGKDVSGALAVLRRMLRLTPQPFESFEPAARLLLAHGYKAEAREFFEQRVRSTPWDLGSAVELALLKAEAPALRALAADRQTPYEYRAKAAKALRNERGLGSEELDALTLESIAPAVAEKPMFHYARLAAAGQASQSTVKIRLLRGALALEPSNAEARSALVETASGAKQFLVVIGALEPVLQQSSVGHALSAGQVDERSLGYWLNDFLRGYQNRASLARLLAQAYENTGELSQAYLMLLVAGKLEPNEALTDSIVAVRAKIDLRQHNLDRMPQIHQGLEETRRVRPRLIASNGGRQ
ncbi:MAG TPA: hypothetical protein VEQ63_15665, partial [Bryobacteraceae bacterium]|nr:hypothetical protein [Bryobacteraceae bacterium]